MIKFILENAYWFLYLLRYVNFIPNISNIRDFNLYKDYDLVGSVFS